MKYTTFTVAAILALVQDATAKRLKSDSAYMKDFTKWASVEGRNYKEKAEFDRRLNLWKDADDFIETKNQEADASDDIDAVRVGHNMFSDMTTDERSRYFGKKQDIRNRQRVGQDAPLHPRYRNQRQSSEESEEPKGGRNLCGKVGINWYHEGKVGIIKDQGGCGSCYAFGATSALEGHIAIATESDPIRVSEQQPVDCAGSGYSCGGCAGGWGNGVTRYGRDHGFKYNRDYEYTATSGGCRYDNKPAVTYQFEEYIDIMYGQGQDFINEIADKLSDGPMTISGHVSCNAFIYYKEGILRQQDCPYGDNVWANHEMALVGYYPPTEEPYENYVDKLVPTQRARDDQDPPNGCKGDREWYIADQDACGYYAKEPQYETFQGDVGVFTVHNSWGPNWGKYGVIHIAAEAGNHYGAANVLRDLHYFKLKDVQLHTYDQ